MAACVSVDLRYEEQLAQAGNAIPHVYFPTGAFISLLRPIEGDNIEVALAGEALRRTIGRYTYVLMTQFAQTAG